MLSSIIHHPSASPYHPSLALSWRNACAVRILSAVHAHPGYGSIDHYHPDRFDGQGPVCRAHPAGHRQLFSLFLGAGARTRRATRGALTAGAAATSTSGQMGLPICPAVLASAASVLGWVLAACTPPHVHDVTHKRAISSLPLSPSVAFTSEVTALPQCWANQIPVIGRPRSSRVRTMTDPPRVD